MITTVFLAIFQVFAICMLFYVFFACVECIAFFIDPEDWND